jgi:hypothetical protein
MMGWWKERQARRSLKLMLIEMGQAGCRKYGIYYPDVSLLDLAHLGALLLMKLATREMPETMKPHFEAWLDSIRLKNRIIKD